MSYCFKRSQELKNKLVPYCYVGGGGGGGGGGKVGLSGPWTILLNSLDLFMKQKYTGLDLLT